jgi:hypothetical protein
MAKVDPEKRAAIEATRQAYYARLASGEEKLPVHAPPPEKARETPTPGQKARMAAGTPAVPKVQFKASGGMVIPDGVQYDDESGRTHTQSGQMSRGALVEDEVKEREIEEALEAAPRPKPNEGKSIADSEQLAARNNEIYIQDNWKNLSWDKMRKLARSLSSENVTNKAKAIEIITAEIERRNSPE